MDNSRRRNSGDKRIGVRQKRKANEGQKGERDKPDLQNRGDEEENKTEGKEGGGGAGMAEGKGTMGRGDEK